MEVKWTVPAAGPQVITSSPVVLVQVMASSARPEHVYATIERIAAHRHAGRRNDLPDTQIGLFSPSFSHGIIVHFTDGRVPITGPEDIPVSGWRDARGDDWI